MLLLLLLSFSLRLVFKPLAHLRDALNRLAGHDADALEELPSFRLREFDSVIDGFNRTLRRLRLIILRQSEAEARARARDAVDPMRLWPRSARRSRSCWRKTASSKSCRSPTA